MKAKERPILYSTPMIQAIQADRKTQTRRTTGKGMKVINQNPDHWNFVGITANGMFHFKNNKHGDVISFPCPYGELGDELWVRETFHPTNQGYSLYKADAENGKLYLGTDDSGPVFSDVKSYKWKPSIFMPRDQSRIQLKITGVRVERLQNISHIDSVCEGISKGDIQGFWKNYLQDEVSVSDPIESFMSLWDSINGDLKEDGSDYSSKSNPWVFVISFKKL
jgi:hypothetical protein